MLARALAGPIEADLRRKMVLVSGRAATFLKELDV
jgi:hypothetical protein